VSSLQHHSKSFNGREDELARFTGKYNIVQKRGYKPGPFQWSASGSDIPYPTLLKSMHIAPLELAKLEKRNLLVCAMVVLGKVLTRYKGGHWHSDF
jgi:hypothetical protein